MKAFGKVLRSSGIGLGTPDIAYTNVAKCWRYSGSNPRAAMRACNRDFPIEQLVKILQPDVVLTLGSQLVLDYAGVRIEVSCRNMSAPYFQISSSDVESCAQFIRSVGALRANDPSTIPIA